MKPLYRVLAVDDSPENLLLLEDLLGVEHEVLLATNGDEALDMARVLRPDLVLLDVVMPGLDGYETCRALRADPALQSIKIILVSGRSMPDERLRGYEAGADDYVSKPFEREELLAKVRVFLRLRHVEEIARMKDDLFTLVAHETRTPMAIVMGALEMLPLHFEAGNAKALELHSAASINIARLYRLLEASTTLAGLRAGRRQLDIVPVAVLDLLRRATSETRARAEQLGVEIHLSAPETMVVLGDPEHLPAGVRTLVEHAIDRSVRGGSVELRATEVNGEAVVAVYDRGTSLTPDDLRAMFEPFDSRDPSHHSSRGSSGLFMAFAREILERLGGRLEVLSRPEGGACVAARLPIAHDTTLSHEAA